MNSPFKNPLSGLLFAALTLLPSASTYACSACACLMHSDWETQGFSSGTGLRLDLRYDFMNQRQLRSGTGKADWPGGHEQELYTRTHSLNVGLDYSFDPDWAINLRAPFLERDHGTYGSAGDGSDAGTSRGQKIGDVKLVGRYQGFLSTHNLGVQFGLKLPTGTTTQKFSGGPSAGDPLDRGLQPGTGTTDAILGAFYHGAINCNWGCFSEVSAQLPINSHDNYRPGASLDWSSGIRYTGFRKVIPQIQVTPRVALKDQLSGAADPDSGGTTVYLSPGVTVPVTEKIKAYGFVQLPIYQNLNGYQLAPRCVLSVGTHIEF